MRYDLTPVRMATTNKSTNNKCWRKCGEKATLLHYWWECKLVQQYGKQYGGTSENQIQNYMYLGIYLDKTFLEKDTCTRMFTAALFTTAKTWKQPKCPLTDDWIRKMWYIYTMEYYSAVKKKEIMPSGATWMELHTK